MKKPTIFFSHSSQDKVPLARLKEAFVSKTGGTINVFLSSDGQSIQLGRNWVYRVQEGLESAALMLVFITPNSIDSKWVYFEAGYSYAKEVRVIPVGFLGIDLAQIGPPISFLQGFNLVSADTCNNLIALTNEQFEYKHPLTFSEQEFNHITSANLIQRDSAFDEISEYVEDVRMSLRKNDHQLLAEPPELIEKMKSVLDGLHVEHQSGAAYLRARGIAIAASSKSSPPVLRIDADPAALHVTLPILVKLLAAIRENGIRGTTLEFELADGMKVVKKDHKITARLYSSDVELLEDGGLAYRGLHFQTGYYMKRSSVHALEPANAYVHVTPIEAKFDAEDAASLLKLLFASNVIYRDQSMFSYLE